MAKKYRNHTKPNFFGILSSYCIVDFLLRLDARRSCTYANDMNDKYLYCIVTVAKQMSINVEAFQKPHASLQSKSPPPDCKVKIVSQKVQELSQTGSLCNNILIL